MDLLNTDFIKAKPLIEKGISISIKRKDTLNLVDFTSYLGTYYYFLDKMDSARFYYEKSIDIAGDSYLKQHTDALNNLGVIASGLGDHQAAREYYSECEKLGVETNDIEMIISAKTHIASTYESENKFQKSLTTLYECLAELEKEENVIGQDTRLYILRSIGTNFYHLDDKKSAKIFYKKVFDEIDNFPNLFDKLISFESYMQTVWDLEGSDTITDMIEQFFNMCQKSSSPFYEARGHLKYAYYYFDEEIIDQAEHSFNEALEISLEYDILDLFPEVYIIGGQIYEQQGRVSLAKKMFEKSLEHEVSIDQTILANQHLYDLSKSAGNPISALSYLENIFALKDSAKVIDNIKLAQRLEVEFQTELLKKDNLLKDEQLKTSKANSLNANLSNSRLTWILSLLGILFLVVSWFAYRSNKNRKELARKNQIIQEYQEKFIEPLSRKIQVKTSGTEKKVESLDLREITFLEKGGTGKTEYKLINKVYDSVGKNSFLIYTTSGKQYIKKSGVQELLQNDLKDSSFARFDANLIVNLHFVKRIDDNIFQILVKEWHRENKRLEENEVILTLADTGVYKSSFLASYQEFQEKSNEISSK